MKKTIALPILVGILVLAGCATPEPEISITERIRIEKEQRKESYLAAHPETEPEMVKAIREERMVVGMTASEAVAAFGAPQRINKSGGINGEIEQGVWSGKYLYFKDGILFSWQTFQPRSYGVPSSRYRSVTGY